MNPYVYVYTYAYFPPRAVTHIVHSKCQQGKFTIYVILPLHTYHYQNVNTGKFTIRVISPQGWLYNEDGIWIGPNSILKNGFIRTNDDAIRVYAGE